MGVPAAMGTRLATSGRKASQSWKTAARAHGVCLAPVQNTSGEAAGATESADASTRHKIPEALLHASHFSIEAIEIPEQIEKFLGNILSESRNINSDGVGNAGLKSTHKKGNGGVPIPLVEDGSCGSSPNGRSDGGFDGGESTTSLELEGTKLGKGVARNPIGQHGSKGGGEDWWSEAESEPTSEVPTDANYMSDSTSVCTATSAMDTEAENKSLQDRRPRNRIVSSRYKAASTRPPSAPKRYPTPLLGQSQHTEAPLPRSTSTERRRPLNKDRSSISRGQPWKPGPAQGMPQTVGLWARTNSLPSGTSDLLDDQSIKEDVSTRIAIGIESKRPMSVRKAASWGSEQETPSRRVETGRASPSAGRTMAGNASSRRSGRESTANDVLSKGGGGTGVVASVGRGMSDERDGRIQRERAQEARTEARPELKRTQTASPRLIGIGAMSRSVDLGSSESEVSGNRRSTVHHSRSRSTSRARLLDSQKMSDSFIEDPQVTPRVAASTAKVPPTNRNAGGREANGGAVVKPLVVVGRGLRGEEGVYRGVSAATPLMVASVGVKARETNRGNGTRRFHFRSNSDIGYSEATPIGFEREIDRVFDRGVSRVEVREKAGTRDPDMRPEVRPDVRPEMGPDRGPLLGSDIGDEVNKIAIMMGEAQPGDANQEGQSDTESVGSFASNSQRALGATRSFGVRSKTWDNTAWQRASPAENQRQGDGGEASRELAALSKGMLNRRCNEGTPIQIAQPNCATVPPRANSSSPWRTSSLLGNIWTAPSAWALSPGRLVQQQQLAMAGASSPPSSPTARPLLLPPPAAERSPLSTPTRTASSPGPRPRSAFVEVGKIRSVVTAANPAQPSATVPAPLISQPPVSSMTPQMLARSVRVLHNRWLQWRFINAKQEAVVKSQQNLAETVLYSAWAATAELRSLVTLQRIKLQRAKQARKLDSVLSAHAMRLDEWSQIKQEHTAAFGGAIEALEAAMLRVPLVNGAKADVEGLTLALATAGEIIAAVNPSITRMLPKVESTESLLSHLAEVVAGERALLEECGELLSYAALLETEERSLRAHILQRAHERERTQEGVAGPLVGISDVLATLRQ